MWNINSNYIIEGIAKNKEMDMYHLVVATTYACNLRCRHCYLPNHSNNRIPLDITKCLIRDWADIVVNDRGRYEGVFHLKGGEPLLDQDFPQIVNEVAGIGVLRLMVTTNGTVTSPRILEALENACEVMEGNHVIINVSLDGTDEETHSYIRGEGNFSKSIKFLGWLGENKIPTHINYVVTNTNIKNLRDIVDIAIEHDVRQINFLPFVAKGSGETFYEGAITPLEIYHAINEIYLNGSDNIKRLLTGTIPYIRHMEVTNQKRNCECVAGYKGFYYVTPDLGVFPCPNLMDKRYSLGNLTKDSIRNIHARKISELYRRVKKHETGPDYSCKGASIYYKEENNETMYDSQLAINEYFNQHPIRGEQKMSFCFSRNI
uniref:Radical SAM additional 4Fe4S-binding SPASM domain-containing protein n=1 Tax=Candidatus Kentrum sp. LFY TaxID=2126342 RepID=A0A450WJ05_9GAMM|nr:MAG: radical SAM additional 4Fe4S-binding SPASM domain-containing protein [Candidatus Kentron sp. LFY]